MKQKLPAFLAMLVFFIAWFLPVERDGVRLADGMLPGYEAFRVAVAPIFSLGRGAAGGPSVRELFFGVSALTNLLIWYALFVAAVYPRRFWPSLRTLSILLVVALCVNAQWLLPSEGQRLNLRIGYWVWCASFPLMALALHRLGRSAPAA